MFETFLDWAYTARLKMMGIRAVHKIFLDTTPLNAHLSQDMLAKISSEPAMQVASLRPYAKESVQ